MRYRRRINESGVGDAVKWGLIGAATLPFLSTGVSGAIKGATSTAAGTGLGGTLAAAGQGAGEGIKNLVGTTGGRIAGTVGAIGGAGLGATYGMFKKDDDVDYVDGLLERAYEFLEESVQPKRNWLKGAVNPAHKGY